jgi:peptidoglycan/LPS O-acetylase OafA/YrhL
MNYWNLNLKAVVLYRIDAIYYGVLAAYISLVKPKFWKSIKYKSVILGIAIILSLNVFISARQIFIESHNIFWNLFYLPINTIAIMFLLPFLSQLTKAPKLILKPITFLSVISYSMYLLHYSIILQLLKIYIPTENLAIFDTLIYILVYLCIVVLLSYILYTIYERPMMNLRDKPFFIKRYLNK